jgi:hypothetical protein
MNNIVEEGGASSLGVKREQERIDLMTQKMMMGRVEPFVVPTMVQATRQFTEIPQR